MRRMPARRRTATPPTAAPMMAPIGTFRWLEVEAAAAASLVVGCALVCALDCELVVVASIEEGLVADVVDEGGLALDADWEVTRIERAALMTAGGTAVGIGIFWLDR